MCLTLASSFFVASFPSEQIFSHAATFSWDEQILSSEDKVFASVDDEPGFNTSGSRQLKTPILSTNVDQKWLETEFSIVICCPTGDK